MASLILICLAALITEEGLVVLALGFIGWLYWLHLRGKREQASPERQRERQRREYWGRAKS